MTTDMTPGEQAMAYACLDRLMGDGWCAANSVAANAAIVSFVSFVIPVARESVLATKRRLEVLAATWRADGAVAQPVLPPPTAQQGVALAQAGSFHDSPHSESPLMQADGEDFSLPAHVIDVDDEEEETPQVPPTETRWQRFMRGVRRARAHGD